MTEQDVQADYTRKVVAARVGLAKALETRILNLKAERNRALELIREGERLNAEVEETQTVKAGGGDETGGGPGQEGLEQTGGPESGLGNGEGQGGQEAETEEPKEPQSEIGALIDQET